MTPSDGTMGKIFESEEHCAYLRFNKCFYFFHTIVNTQSYGTVGKESGTSVSARNMLKTRFLDRTVFEHYLCSLFQVKNEKCQKKQSL